MPPATGSATPERNAERGPCQKGHHIRHLLGLACATGSSHLAEDLPRLFFTDTRFHGDEGDFFLAHVGEDVSRADCIAADVLAPNSAATSFVRPTTANLVTAVGAVSGRPEARHGRVVDDRPAPSFDHLRNHGLAEMHHALHVDLPAQVPVLTRRVEEGPDTDRGSGVVEEDVDTAEGLARLLDAGQDLSDVGHVHRQRERLGAERLDLGHQPLEGCEFSPTPSNPSMLQVLALPGEVGDDHARPLLG